MTLASAGGLDALRTEHAWLQDNDYHHDGYMHCWCRIAVRIRELIALDVAPLKHRLAKID